MRITIIISCVLVFLLLVLAIIPTLMELRAMYMVTRRWQLNRYMKLLVREGIIYFFV